MEFKTLTTCFAGGGIGHYIQKGRLKSDTKNTENQVVNLHPDLQYETFEGFGGAVTAVIFLWSLMTLLQKEKTH